MRTATGIVAASKTEYERLYMARKRKAWRQARLCSLCGHASRPGMRTCQRCSDLCSAANRRMDDRRRLAVIGR